MSSGLAVRAGAAVADLDQPRPDLVGRRVDLDPAGVDRIGLGTTSSPGSGCASRWGRCPGLESARPLTKPMAAAADASAAPTTKSFLNMAVPPASILRSRIGARSADPPIRPGWRPRLLDADRGGLELGRAGLRIGGVDREDVRLDVVLEVEGHEGQAGRSEGSSRTGASIEPRREVMRTRSPSARSIEAASSGEMSSDSPRRSGEV